MPTLNAHCEIARRWRIEELDGLELMTARYFRHSYPKHLHDTYVIAVMEMGVEGFDCQGQTYVAPPGSIVLINPGEVHTGYSASREPWSYRSLYPSPRLLTEILPHFHERAKKPLAFSSRVVWDRQIAKMLLHAHHKLVSEKDMLTGQTVLAEALHKLIRRYSLADQQGQPSQIDHVGLHRVRDYLLDNLACNTSLCTLAQIGHLSPFHLVRSFKECFGLPPHKFLINARVERATKLLGQDMPIAQVAYETGFSDQSHLTRSFKRIVGVTPAKYIQ